MKIFSRGSNLVTLQSHVKALGYVTLQGVIMATGKNAVMLRSLTNRASVKSASRERGYTNITDKTVATICYSLGKRFYRNG